MSKILLCGSKTGKTTFCKKYNLKEFDKLLFSEDETVIQDFFTNNQLIIGNYSQKVASELLIRKIKYTIVFFDLMLKNQYIKMVKEGLQSEILTPKDRNMEC